MRQNDGSVSCYSKGLYRVSRRIDPGVTDPVLRSTHLPPRKSYSSQSPVHKDRTETVVPFEGIGERVEIVPKLCTGTDSVLLSLTDSTLRLPNENTPSTKGSGVYPHREDVSVRPWAVL